jgi:DNA-binding protein H-NS
MSKLTAIRKQIAALEAEAARISQVEIKAAIAKVKEIMSEFGLTIEHLSGAISKVGKKAAAKKAVAKRAGVSVAKYADPKTGKTWSGFGRAPYAFRERHPCADDGAVLRPLRDGYRHGEGRHGDGGGRGGMPVVRQQLGEVTVLQRG